MTLPRRGGAPVSGRTSLEGRDGQEDSGAPSRAPLFRSGRRAGEGYFGITYPRPRAAA